MKIYVATCEDNTGYGYQKAFKEKKPAEQWLKNKVTTFFKNSGADCTFDEYFENSKTYGAFTAKIKSFSI